MKKVLLASKSPRRKTLLEWAEVDFEIRTIDADESFPADMPVEDVPVFIARKKTKIPHDGNTIVIAADTVVVLGNEVIGKPANREEAITILTKLSGRTHRVITGVVICIDEREFSFHDITEVEFHVLTQEQIVFYVDKYKPYDKAGAYAIQEWIGVTGIKKITGDFYNVMGLPVSRVVKILADNR